MTFWLLTPNFPVFIEIPASFEHFSSAGPLFSMTFRLRSAFFQVTLFFAVPSPLPFLRQEQT
jgi:hypothetical protein